MTDFLDSTRTVFSIRWFRRRLYLSRLTLQSGKIKYRLHNLPHIKTRP